MDEAIKRFTEEAKPQANVVIEGDIIATKKNILGRKARLGTTGKWYCGGKHACGHTDGGCGPTNGCNCIPCHDLDIKYRRLPNGYLVNLDGNLARRSKETNKIYCGTPARLMMSDGYCGPTNGPQCGACKCLEEDIKNGHGPKSFDRNATY